MLRSLLALFLFAGLSASAADFTKSIANGRHIFGDKAKESDLKGKVILLEYWGVN